MTFVKQGTDQQGQAPTRVDAADLRSIAPLWHTAALILLISAVAVIGSSLSARGAASSASGKVGAYVPMLLVPWLLTFYVVRVGRDDRAHRSLATLLGAKWSSGRRAAVDLVLGMAVALVILACERALSPAIDARAAALVAILPRSLAERLAWIAVALGVGFGEEVVYRGYLQTQLGALTRRPWLGVVLQALLFGIAHLEQGPASAGRIAVYGVILGVLVRARRSVLPAIVAHVAVDLVSAFA
jgi:membrane protease YdiL (CAAX protease family)